MFCYGMSCFWTPNRISPDMAIQPPFCCSAFRFVSFRDEDIFAFPMGQRCLTVLPSSSRLEVVAPTSSNSSVQSAAPTPAQNCRRVAWRASESSCLVPADSTPLSTKNPPFLSN